MKNIFSVLSTNDAHKQRENICYLVIIIGFDSNDSKYAASEYFFFFVCAWRSQAERKYLLLFIWYLVIIIGFDSDDSKHAASEYFFCFVCHDAHKQRENICYLVVIIGFDSNDSKHAASEYFFLFCLRMTLTSREKISVTFYLILSNHYRIRLRRFQTCCKRVFFLFCLPTKREGICWLVSQEALWNESRQE